MNVRLYTSGPADRSFRAYSAWITSIVRGLVPDAPERLNTPEERWATIRSWRAFWAARDAHTRTTGR